MKNKKEKIENWKKEFDEISYYQKVKMKDGSYILVCQNSHLIEKIRQLLKYEKEKDRQKFIEILERLKLEFDVNVCECGEKWNETDAADIVNEAIKQLKDE